MTDNPRVLVVDDDLLIALNIKSELEQRGWTVLEPAGNVPTAMRVVLTHCLAIGVLDIHLGEDTNSFPVADALAARNIPFIFVSGYDVSVLPDHLSETPFLSKPIDFPELDKVLRSHATVLPRHN